MLKPIMASLSLLSAEDRLLNVAKKLEQGQLSIRFGDGPWRQVGSKSSGVSAALHLKNPSAVLRRYLSSGSVGFAESYIEGEWDTSDLPTLLELLDSNQDAIGNDYFGGWFGRQVRRFQHFQRRNSKSGSAKNIHAHYDLGNEFFERWLDASMTYSAALFEDNQEALDKAQQRKYRKLANELAISPGQHVLEIGCGWGGFAEIVAKEFDAKLTCVTISKEQHSYALKRMQKQGLNEKVEVRLQDYRDISDSFDRVASIEMFEAVGEQYWPVFFERMRRSLKPGGRAGLQIITIADKHFDSYRRNADFIQRYIFPGGMLPSPAALNNHIESAGLNALVETSFGQDYAKTLALWHERFEEAWDSIRPLGFDERFRRIWRYYLAYCEAGFRTGSTDVKQLVLASQ